MFSFLSCNMSQQGLSRQSTADESRAFLEQAILENLPVTSGSMRVRHGSETHTFAHVRFDISVLFVIAKH